MSTYLDCNATTPIDPRVRDLVVKYLSEEFGNSGSRTHEFGLRAKQAVENARRQVAAVVGAQADEVLFTSGATEGNNLAILGLAVHGEATGHRHVITTAIEHKAVLEPCDELERRGFTVTRLAVGPGGYVDPAAVAGALRPDTLLVSVMHANNETGILQPIAEIAAALGNHHAWFHVDAAQGFGKDLEPLRNPRVELISVSGHKLYAPKGVGALLARRRGFQRPPLRPLVFGGGQERGLRPGTLPVHLIAGLGLAAELAVKEHAQRLAHNLRLREQILAALVACGARLNGDPGRALPHVLNLGFDGLDSEAVMLAWKGVVAVSNGSACTSHSYTPSHVLLGMGMDRARVDEALRLSWSYLTELPDVEAMVAGVAGLR
jgi:cysteine desulfurase